ncbi:MAG: universal stress protein [Paludibacteraceae bacterium]|nr:universal stress protein [Paludibacteraceae bacterium]
MNLDILHTDDIRVEHCDGTRRDIQQVLDACREERRPYVVIKEQGIKSQEPRQISNNLDSTDINLDSWFLSPESRILVPISMLEEEVYKAEICTYLARKTGAHLILLRARDYGSKAKQNTQRIITHIHSIAERTGKNISYEVQVATRDSFSFHKDFHSEEWKHDLLLLTASREYGLDDWLFGPPELYAIRHNQVPVMLVNPRADLFSLCD